MTTQSNIEYQSFRFHTRKGKSLTDEIAALEVQATRSLRDGVSLHSVQTGAIALLRMLLTEVTGQLVELAPSDPACAPTPKPPRCAPPEG